MGARLLDRWLFVVATAACSSSPAPVTSARLADDAGAGTHRRVGRDGGSSLAYDDEGVPIAPPGSYGVTFGPITVAPGEERVQCVTRRLGNADRIHVGKFHNVRSGASHHMAVYRVSDRREQTTPYDCAPFSHVLGSKRSAPLLITQREEEEIELPEGVAYTLEPNQMIRIEVHWVNAGDRDAKVSVTSIMTPIDASAYANEADILYIATADISIPPNSKTSAGPIFFQLPKEYADAKFFALTGHAHHLATNVRVAVAASRTDPGKSVYDVPGWSWSEPETVRPDPPFTVPAGGGFDFTCEWNNTTNRTVRFGPSAEDDEMCSFWAYYYPSKGAKVCFHRKDGDQEIDECCPGSSLCQYFE
jgi:hypothetical protein